jgi:hypothetical protein
MKVVKKTSDEYSVTRTEALAATWRDSPDHDTITAAMGKFNKKIVKLGDIGKLEVLAAIGNLVDKWEVEDGIS